MGKKLELPKWHTGKSVYWIDREDWMTLWEGLIRSVDEVAQTALVVAVCRQIDRPKDPMDKTVPLDRLRSGK